VGAMKWGLSVLDWCSHAINERADHPIGVYVAECGHLLMMATTLHDRPPGRVCPACARWSPPVNDGNRCWVHEPARKQALGSH
jgi:hypothetical protein